VRISGGALESYNRHVQGCMYVWTPYLESRDIPNPSIKYLRVAIDNNGLTKSVFSQN
jgi:hypothetical protein